MFTSGFQESRDAEVSIAGTPDAFKILLDFLYTGVLDVNPQTTSMITDVLEMAHYLQLARVVSKCEKLLIKDLSHCSMTEVVQFKSISNMFELERLENRCKKYLAQNFDGSNYFLRLMTHQLILETMAVQSFDVMEEKKVFDVIVAWLKHDWDARKQFAAQLFQKIRLGAVQPGHVTVTFLRTPELNNIPECQQMVVRVMELRDNKRPGDPPLSVSHPDLFEIRSAVTISSLEILRCLAQPFSEDEVTEMQKNNLEAGGLPKMQSKQSIAESLAERDRILSIVLEEMSAGTASVVKDALKTGNGHPTQTSSVSTTRPKNSPIRPFSAKYPSTNKSRPKSGNPPSSAKSAKNEYSTKHKNNSSDQLAPELSGKEPIYWQCTMYMLEICGGHFVHMLRSVDKEVAKMAMLVLYDIVTFGEVIVHMKLASLGIISILTQIINQHGSTQDLTLLGLMILQQLVASEYRLKQLFIAEGGQVFLETLAKTSQGATRAHVEQFLSFISQSGPSLY